MHKMFNEFQAKKFIKNYGMSIIGVRPANVTGPDKVRGSVDHVQIMVDAARNKPVHLPAKGLMRLLVLVSLAYPVYYLLVSWVITVRAKRKRKPGLEEAGLGEVLA